MGGGGDHPCSTFQHEPRWPGSTGRLFNRLSSTILLCLDKRYDKNGINIQYWATVLGTCKEMLERKDALKNKDIKWKSTLKHISMYRLVNSNSLNKLNIRSIFVSLHLLLFCLQTPAAFVMFSVKKKKSGRLRNMWLSLLTYKPVFPQHFKFCWKNNVVWKDNKCSYRPSHH